MGDAGIAKKKILIIDDEKDWVTMLSIRLKSEGYDVDVAFDAVSGMMQIRQANPALVLLDIMLPAGGGVSVLKNIRNNTKTFSLPVIVVSARLDDAIKEETKKLGITDYFVKSNDTAELMTGIKKLLEPKN
ncbi:MAG: hypothetical protein COS99_04415 [Candidatus Omnitrophica bacterium CG07_land_8_20_14_0_80_42_15]|uniref:Response regulatory domain-containing protein n=1 Tax=Candidatus Aquitaenariimonas noxiae TaxID=1974741 RepID=A0A2J0KT09_9BACT|nr:MAG: hypothetical protein COS99_04415 [Candidatus Omnitrophica bacterium CG07_land_8_20_14_0_80_42_15]